MGRQVRRSAREQRSDAALNRDALVQAATAAVHREGIRVRMSTIAEDAGVGIGTLYRHFPTREDLLNHLTHRSFEMVLANARSAESLTSTGNDGSAPFHRSRHRAAGSARPSAPRRTSGNREGHPRPSRTDPPRPPAAHRPWPSRRHDQDRRQPSRHRRDRGDARPADTERPGMGRDLQADSVHLPRRSQVDFAIMTTSSAVPPPATTPVTFRTWCARCSSRPSWPPKKFGGTAGRGGRRC